MTQAAMAESYGVWQGATRGGAQGIGGGSGAMASDLALTRKAASGDMQAFEEVYRLHHRRVYSICLRMTGSPTEAEDLTQDIFIHLFHKIGGFRGESAFTTWLHRMTINQVLMHFRRQKRRRAHPVEEVELSAEVVDRVELSGRMPVLDQIALDDALAKLPHGYRTVLILHDVEGYEHEEIARRLGCATGTSKSQLHKARLRLRKLLARTAIKLRR